MFKKFHQFSAVLAICVCASSTFADQAPNPRSAVSANTNSGRVNATKVTTRGDGSSDSVVSRGATVSARSSSNNVTARTGTAKATVARSGRTNTVKSNRVMTNARSATVPARAAAGQPILGRSAIPGIKNNARSAINNVSNMGMARAANVARATAVFGDVSKIGGGYAQCREAYATCMDQFCANANDTFRRCYCSEKFTQFQDTEAMFEEVKGLLQRFEDNNLNAVDKTAAEVNAMYTATIGEAAIKNDVSGAQSILSEIGDLLSGKQKVAAKNEQKSTSLDLGSLTSGITFDMNDIWGGGSFDDMFSNNNRNTGPNMAEMSGKELYNVSNQQCLEIVADACSSNAVLNMATSSYGIMITQDCNLYEKKLDAQRQAIQNTVREAEKMLRVARLEEYQAHNSADVNECIGEVRSAMLKETACGSDYKRCLDYSGQYINQTTGDPIYSPLLFKLTEMIDLYNDSGTDAFGDVLSQNAEFDKFLDAKKMFANTALDSCRDIADTVWTEFKRTAIIEIAQAQDEKIEEVKNSCVKTMGECYDTQSGALKDFDTTSAQSSGAIAASAARAMCADKVATCAALYGNGKDCLFDDQGRVENATKCGLTELLNFVATVDSTKIAEGCADAMTKYAQDICAPSASDDSAKYPWGCRIKPRDELEKSLLDRAGIYCNVGAHDNNLSAELLDYTNVVSRLSESISSELSLMLNDACESVNGIWIDAVRNDSPEQVVINKSVYKPDGSVGQETTNYNIYKYALPADWEDNKNIEVFLDKVNISASIPTDTYGVCIENNVKINCDAQGGAEYATYDERTGSCVFTDKWYEEKCTMIGGYFENNICYYAGE